MPTIRKPRSGSMQYWPRKRAKRHYTRVKSWAKIKEAKLLGFAGYKVGMTHAMITDNKKTSMTKNQEIFCPLTIIECPPLKSASIRFYKKTIKGLKPVSEIFAEKVDKELERKITIPKNIKKKIEDIKDFDDITMLVYTQPKLTGIGKKKPELFEIAIGGNKEEKLNYAKENLGKEIDVKDVLTEGQQLDTHAVTKGKGFQGAVKRYGIALRSHKSEKHRRTPGSLGGWKGHAHFMWKVAYAGKMGFHVRTEHNKLLLKIGDKVDEINTNGGFLSYGVIKSQYILIKGSIAGAKKRLIRFNFAIRPDKKIPNEAPTIQHLSIKPKVS
jgi:large subunit ribosomal protein L3